MRNALVAMIVALITLTGCSSTQKTQGQGMVSVVAQNAVRIAGSEAVSKLDISEVYGKKAHVVVTGFADEFNRGYVLNLLRDAVEDAGGQLEAEGRAELTAMVPLVQLSAPHSQISPACTSQSVCQLLPVAATQLPPSGSLAIVSSMTLPFPSVSAFYLSQRHPYP